MKNLIKVMMLLTLPTFILLHSSASAQQRVDQGAPGTQGPWPIRGTVIATTIDDGGTTPVRQGPSRDGGLYWPVDTVPHSCNIASPNKVTNVTNASTTTPSAAQAGRLWTTVCNSVQNVSSRVVKCRADGTAPVFALTNAGDVLSVGDCALYTVSDARNILCIANTAAGTDVQTYECF